MTTQIRETVVQIATASIGLAANPYAGKMDAYLDLIADGETTAMRNAFVNMSGCALVVRGIWRRAGLKDARLEAPYKLGTAVVLLVEMAHEAGAWRSGAEVNGGEYMPDEGDVFLLEGPEHVATFLRQVQPDGAPLSWDSIDGGQRDVDGREAIATVRRTVYATNQMMTLNGRALAGVVDLDALAARFGA